MGRLRFVFRWSRAVVGGVFERGAILPLLTLGCILLLACRGLALLGMNDIPHRKLVQPADRKRL